MKDVPTPDLRTLTGLVEIEIRALQPALVEDLTTTGYGSALKGVAEVAERLPSSYEDDIVAAPKPLPALEEVLGEEAPYKASLPILDDAVATLKRSPVSAGVNYRDTADRVRAGAFAITTDLGDAAVGKVRDILAEAMETGISRDDFIDTVVTKLEEGTLSEPHLETIFRTNTHSALSEGRKRALSQPVVIDAFPYVAYSATHDARVRPEHKALETLGLQGTNIYRFDDPVFQMFRPPWSYNCLMPGTVVQGRFNAGFRSEYSGEVIEITTHSGHKLSMTVNHPVLTEQGFIPADSLTEGQNIVSYVGGNKPRFESNRFAASSGSDQPSLSLINTNEYYQPSTIKQVFSTLSTLSGIRRLHTSPQDFYGDAVRGKGYVDVVASSIKLLNWFESDSLKSLNNFLLSLMDVSKFSLSSNCYLSSMLRRVVSPSSSLPSGSALPLNRFRIKPKSTPLEFLRFGPGSELNSSEFKTLVNDPTTYSKREPNRLDGFSREIASSNLLDRYSQSTLTETTSSGVSLDKIVRLRRSNWSGHVYDLQSEEGFIIANGIIVSNCRCAWYPQTVEQAAKRGVREAKEWLARAVAMATELGGDYNQYIGKCSPVNPEFVPAPDFAPSPEFRRL